MHSFGHTNHTKYLDTHNWRNIWAHIFWEIFGHTYSEKYLGTNIWRNVQPLCMPGSKKWQFSPSWRRLGASVDSDQSWRDSYKKLQRSGNTRGLWNIQHLKRMKIHLVNHWDEYWTIRLVMMVGLMVVVVMVVVEVVCLCLPLTSPSPQEPLFKLFLIMMNTVMVVVLGGVCRCLSQPPFFFLNFSWWWWWRSLWWLCLCW